MGRLPFAAFVFAVLAAAVPAAAQRFPFERVVDVTPGATLDVTTVRGKVFVEGHDPKQIRIEGEVTVRAAAGFRTANPVDVARRVAENPRIEVAGNVVRLRPPSDPEEQVSVTVSYVIHVPHDTKVIVTTDSGEVRVDRVSAALRIVTQSSAMTLRGLAGALEARTQSGAIRGSFAGAGSADVESGSSAIQLDGLSGRLLVRSQSGRVEVRGTPTAAWDVTTGSSLIEAAFPPSATFTLEATSRSSSVRLRGVKLDGVKEKGRASGTVGGGGPDVRLASRSGQIHIGH